METDPTRTRAIRNTIAVVAAITLLGVVLRWSFLDHPMRYDESYNYLHFASHSPGYIGSHYEPNNHVLHTLLVCIVRRFVGDEPWMLRLPAFVAGVLLIPAAAWLGWRVGRRHFVAVGTALAVCGSSALVEYSANARGYSMLALFTTLAVGLTIELLERPAKPRAWVGWGVLLALGAFTVPVMLFPAVGLCVSVVIFGMKRPAVGEGFVLGVVVCVLLTGLFYLPVIVVEGPGKLVGMGDMAYEVLGKQVESPGDVAASALELWVRHAPSVWQVVAAIGTCVYLWVAAKAREPRLVVPILVIAGWLATAGILRAPLPARMSLFALPLILAAMVTGAWHLLEQPIQGLAVRRIAVPVMAALLVCPLVTVSRQQRLCAEPGGLVEVEPAIADCTASGAVSCALVAPYTPATTYYANRSGGVKLVPADDPASERVYVVTTPWRSLDELWQTGSAGFEAYDRPRLLRVLPTGAVFVAERVAPSVVRR